MSELRLQLRKYARSDLNALFELDRICFQSPFRFSKAEMRRVAEAKNARVVIAEAHGELAGFCIVHLQSSERRLGYLVTIDVAPLFRHKGVAQRLLQSAESHLRLADYTAMVLHVFVGNGAAIRLYEQNGYSLQGSQKNFYGTGLHAYVFDKTVTGAYPNVGTLVESSL